MKDFGFVGKQVEPKAFLRKGGMVSFGAQPFRIDILTSVSGAEFEACYARRLTTDLEGVPATVIAFEDLIANKLASARPRDLADASELRDIQRQLHATSQRARATEKKSSKASNSDRKESKATGTTPTRRRKRD